MSRPNEVLFPLSLEEMQSFSDLLHGRRHIRFDPDSTWTAEKSLQLSSRVDAELALMRAAQQPTKDVSNDRPVQGSDAPDPQGSAD